MSNLETPSGGRLAGKVALVTGGGSGIGEAVVRRFAAEGAAVLVMDRDVGAAERVAGDIARGVPFTGDVVDPAVSKAAVAHAVAEFGGLHVAANVAGISGPLIPTQDYPCQADPTRLLPEILLLGGDAGVANQSVACSAMARTPASHVVCDDRRHEPARSAACPRSAVAIVGRSAGRACARGEHRRRDRPRAR